jgi:type II secretory pathway component PulC
VAACPSHDPFDGLQEGDIIRAINGAKVGSSDFDSLEKVLFQLGQEVDVMMEVDREL